MATKGNLVQLDEREGSGWKCDACEWTHPYPRLIGPKEIPSQELKGAFDDHKCENYPRKRKPREDFSQAAARIVRTATET